MPLLDNHRWVVPSTQFAAVLRLPDAPGFFSKQIVLEPGIAAGIVDDGTFVGELRPGTHTLQSFSERLQFWKKKQATVILTREEEQRLTIRFANVPTLENVPVTVEVMLSVQVEDVLKFLVNLLGPRDGYSLDELRSVCEPILRQALWSAVGRSPLVDLTGPDSALHIEKALDDALKVSLGHYGLGFSHVQLVTISQPQYDAQRRHTGELWLRREGLDGKKALDDLKAAEEFQRLSAVEKENELKLLAQHLGVDLEEGEHAVTVERMALRRQIREDERLDELNALETDEKRREYLAEIDRKRLLRADEVDAVVVACRGKKEDREAARRQVRALLEVEQQADVTRLRAELDHRQRLATKDFELELAQKTGSEENERWSRQVEREKREAEHRRGFERSQWEHDKVLGHDRRTDARADEMESMLHHQKLARIKGEVEFEAVQRTARVDEIATERRMASARAQAKLDQEMAASRRETEHQGAMSQLDRLAAVQKLNLEMEERRQELKARDRRSEWEIEQLRTAQVFQHELDKLTRIGSMSRSSQVAVASAENAALVVELARVEESSRTASDDSRRRAEVAEAVLKANQEAAEKQERSDREKVDMLVALFREKDQASSNALQQGLQATVQVATARPATPPGYYPPAMPAHYPPAYPPPYAAPPAGWPGSVPPAAPHTPPAPVAEMACPHCHAVIEIGSRSCKACSARLA
jgi:hypothetical protein